MVNNNIVIRINGQNVDYDDDTAVAISLTSYNLSKPGTINLSGTNEFTLPITPNNKKAFTFAENTSSKAQSMYEKMECYIYLSGVVILHGECYVKSITDRYSVQFIEGKNVFDKLKELSFVKLHSNAYPISLVSKLAYEWNNVELPKIQQLYNPSTPQEYVDAILTYTMENYDGNPVRDFCIPVVKNIFAEKNYIYDNDGGVGEITNNLFDNDTPKEGKGFIIGKSFGYSHLQKRPTQYEGVYYYGGGKNNADVSIPRYGITLLSPFWVSVSRVVDMLEEYTGYNFTFLTELIESYSNKRLFLHIPALEFDTTFAVSWHTQTVSSAQWNNSSMQFEGKVQCLKGNMEWYGHKLEDGSVNNIYDDDLQTDLTCFDLLKSLMQEFNLTCYIDEFEKRIVFRKFERLKTSQASELSLIAENTKKFSIDDIKQKQTIAYKEIADNTPDKRLQLVCNNKNLDEGGNDTKLVEIERYIWSAQNYNWSLQGKKGYSKNICTIDNEANATSFSFGYPSNYNTTGGTGFIAQEDIQQVCLSLAYRPSGEFYDEDGLPMTKPSDWDDARKHCELTIYCSSDLECMKAGNYINKVEQLTVGQTDAYDYLQDTIYTPIYEEVTVKKDILFLKNWEALRKVHIKGLTGNWYVQEVSKFNPRTDDTMTLKIVKLPAAGPEI